MKIELLKENTVLGACIWQILLLLQLLTYTGIVRKQRTCYFLNLVCLKVIIARARNYENLGKKFGRIN